MAEGNRRPERSPFPPDLPIAVTDPLLIRTIFVVLGAVFGGAIAWRIAEGWPKRALTTVGGAFAGLLLLAVLGATGGPWGETALSESEHPMVLTILTDWRRY